MPELINSEAEIHYDLAGDGDALVLIPGFASGAWSWKHQVTDFADHFRVLTFDPRGVGRSRTVDGAEASIERIADDILAVLDQAGIEKAHMLGISFGGFVAQHIAVTRPERVAKLVLASTTAGGRTHVPPEPSILAAFGRVAAAENRHRLHLEIAFTPEFKENSADVVDDFCTLREANSVEPHVHSDQLTAALGFDARQDLQKITAPTLVITGDQDSVVPAANSIHLAAAIAHARLEIIAGAGHMFFVESPEIFNRAVIDFLLE